MKITQFPRRLRTERYLAFDCYGTPNQPIGLLLLLWKAILRILFCCHADPVTPRINKIGPVGRDRNRTTIMKRDYLLGPGFRTFLATIRTAIVFSVVFPAFAENVPHLSVIQPGGMPGLPTVTGIEQGSNSVIVTWDGPSGYYQLFHRSDAVSGTWQRVGSPSLSRRMTLPQSESNNFFRVNGPAPHYAGARSCQECHSEIYAEESLTKHAHALDALKTLGQESNPDCLRCHTVGRNPDPSQGALPTGFISELRTPHLAGVQCENCHGPAGLHAARETDPTVRPRVELASTVCGGCHNASTASEGVLFPHFEEWAGSPHAGVVEDMNPDGRISSCGRCHSGSARLSLLKGDPLPEGDANVGIVCATCHDPHRQHVHVNVLDGVMENPLNGFSFTNNILGAIYTNQLRNPLASSHDFFLTTSDDFAAKYDPTVNLCGQCHNHRGASWTSSSRAPHHSPQYNILLGTVGELPEGTQVHASTHALFEKQCITCHMQRREPEAGQPQLSAHAGHTFRVQSYDACRSCHSFPEQLVPFATGVVSNRIHHIKGLLDTWGATKAPEPLRTTYGTAAWEYTNPGDLSAGRPAPSSAEQALIPSDIKRARFNLYLVLYDGSFGIHNAPYSVALLDAAENWVQQALHE